MKQITSPPAGLVPLRIDQPDRVQTVWIAVSRHDDGVDEVRIADQVVGYLYRADHVFVALLGCRKDRAEECGQSLLWDKAAAALIAAAGVPVPELHDFDHDASAARRADPGRLETIRLGPRRRRNRLTL